MLERNFPAKEKEAGDFKQLASAMIMRALYDAMHLMVPMHAEAHVRRQMPYVAYQRGNPNSDLIPWTREVIDARNWLLNDGYDRWLNDENKADETALTLSACAAELGKSADDIRALASNAIKLSRDAETMWLPTDLDKVQNYINKLKRQMESKL